MVYWEDSYTGGENREIRVVLHIALKPKVAPFAATVALDVECDKRFDEGWMHIVSAGPQNNVLARME